MLHIAIATCSEFPNLGPYDRGVIDALAELGVSAKPMIWTDASAPFEEMDGVVIQSTWDSHLDPNGFLEWVRRVEARVPLYNPVRLLEKNLHKGYLRELARAGVPVTPTLWVQHREPVDLRDEMRVRDWIRIVIKPAVSAGATETYTFDFTATDEAQRTLDRLSELGDVMVQPYLDAFETEGERSYIFLDGELSHAVHRPPTLQSTPRAFKEARTFEPADAYELGVAKQALEAIGEIPLYARIDVATNNDGLARLQEVELVEPCLFTSLAPGAQQRLAAAIVKRISG